MTIDPRRKNVKNDRPLIVSKKIPINDVRIETDVSISKTRKKTNTATEKKRETEEKKLRKIAKLERTKKRKAHERLKNERKKLSFFSNKILSWCSECNLNSIAKLTKLIVRTDAKISAITLLLTLICSVLNDGCCTYNTYASNMGVWFNVRVTAQSIWKRFNDKKTVTFLEKVLSDCMTSHLSACFKNGYSNVFSCFTGVWIEDSTVISLNKKARKKFKGSGGSASKSSAKLNCVYDITSKSVEYLDVSSGSKSDLSFAKKMKSRIKKGVLLIRDLGYFDVKEMLQIHKLKAFFVSRLKKDVLVYLNKSDEAPVDIYKLLNQETTNGNLIDLHVYVTKDKIPLRLVGERVPEFVREKRIKSYKKNKIKRDKSKLMKSDYVDWFGYSVFLTNIYESKLSVPELIISVYKIRWQIELVFKRWKSILKLNVIKGASAQRVLCLVYIKLIAMLMMESIVSYAASLVDDDEEVSEHKTLVWLQECNRLGMAIVNAELEELLGELIRSIDLLQKNRAVKKLSTYKMLSKKVQEGALTGETTIYKPIQERSKTSCDYGEHDVEYKIYG